jgi:hypothetical protein
MCSSLGDITYGEEARIVTIKIQNWTPKFEPSAWIQKSGGDRKAFAPAATQNVLESTFQLSNDWFTDVDIKIVWKTRDCGDEEDDPGHWVQLRFTRDFQDASYTIPVYFGCDRSRYEMDHLDKLKHRNDQWQVYLRSVQIARHYQGKAGYEDQFGRAARRAFYSAVTLTVEYYTPPFIILMSDDATQLVSDFGGTFKESATQAKSTVWKDLEPMVRKYADKTDCDTVKLILKAYQALKDREPIIFETSKQSRNLLKELSVDNRIARKCPGLAEPGDLASTGISSNTPNIITGGP